MDKRVNCGFYPLTDKGDKQLWMDRYHDLEDEWREEQELSLKRFEGWTREYNKRKALEKELEYNQRCKDSQYDEILRLKDEVNHWRTEAQVKGTLLKTPLFTDAANIRIQDLEKENALLESENRDLGSRILDLTRKLTAADDLALSLKAQLNYYKPVWYTVAPVNPV